MKAFAIAGKGSTDILDLPVPEVGPDEVRLAVKSVGFCGSDLSTFRGKNSMVEFPRIPGHEIAATIDEVGSGVPSDISRGQNVTAVPYTACGVCSSCLRGQTNACRYNQTLGVQRDGAMTEYIVLPYQKLIIPKKLDPARLVLVEPLTVGFHAVARAEVTDSDTVLVLGCGMIGMGAVIRAAERGATVIAGDIDQSKLQTAMSFGASEGIDMSSDDSVRVLNELTDGNGPDVVVEAVGHPSTYSYAVSQVAFAGRIACIGYAAADTELPTRLFVQKELTIRGSRNATALDFKAAAKYLETTSHPVDGMISKRVLLGNAGDALEQWDKDPTGILKIVVDVA